MPTDESPVPQLPKVSLVNRKILIVEDESMLAWELEDILHELGSSHVFWTASLEGARDILKVQPDISLVLLDLKLRDANGEALIDELTGKGIPFIVVTGYSPKRAYEFPVLTKPYSVKALMNAISRALERISS